MRSEEGNNGHQAAPLRPALLQRSQIKMLPLEALPAPKKTPILKHIGRHGIQGPVIPLPRIPRLPGHLYEAVIQRQVVADRVLPRRELLPIIGEALTDKIAYLAEGKSLLGALEDGHGDESDVRVRRLRGGGSPAWSIIKAGGKVSILPLWSQGWRALRTVSIPAHALHLLSAVCLVLHVNVRPVHQSSVQGHGPQGPMARRPQQSRHALEHLWDRTNPLLLFHSQKKLCIFECLASHSKLSPPPPLTSVLIMTTAETELSSSE